MDLSGLKWPLIIVVVVAIGWLGSSGGINWMISQSTDAVPGADATQDARDEQRLTSVAGYLLTLWRYEKMGRPGEAVNTLMEVMRQRPQITDDRVPGWDNLKLRATKIAETHQETLTDQVRQLNDM
jgi:hypothetical protein